MFSFISAPGEPPLYVNGSGLNSTSIVLNMSPPSKDDSNGIIIGYQVTYWTTEDVARSRNFTRVGEELVTTIEITNLRKMFNHSVIVKAYNKAGIGPASNITVIATLEAGMFFTYKYIYIYMYKQTIYCLISKVFICRNLHISIIEHSFTPFLEPSLPPQNFTVTPESHDRLILSWRKIPYLSTHGLMQNFTVSCKGTLANSTIHYVFDVVQYQENTMFFQYEMRDLFPDSVYSCTIDGCTNVGCGPNVTASNRSKEYCKFIIHIFFKPFKCYFLV